MSDVIAGYVFRSNPSDAELKRIMKERYRNNNRKIKPNEVLDLVKVFNLKYKFLKTQKKELRRKPRTTIIKSSPSLFPVD